MKYDFPNYPNNIISQIEAQRYEVKDMKRNKKKKFIYLGFFLVIVQIHNIGQRSLTQT